jgi:hypothetical protein
LKIRNVYNIYGKGQIEAFGVIPNPITHIKVVENKNNIVGS